MPTDRQLERVDEGKQRIGGEIKTFHIHGSCYPMDIPFYPNLDITIQLYGECN